MKTSYFMNKHIEKAITKNYKLNGVSLAETSSTTYLGVELSADMNGILT